MSRRVVLALAIVLFAMILAGGAPATAAGAERLDAAADAEFLGKSSGDRAGQSVASAGDVNGDGFDDILVGADANADGGQFAGAAFLVLGGPDGWSLAASLGQPNIVQYIGEPVTSTGHSVAGAGDVNGDGYDDILIGAPFNNDAGTSAGAAFLVLGSATPTGGALGAIQYSGETGDSLAGWSVAGAGDVNKDGYDDMLVGAVGNDEGGSNTGAAYLILGSASPASLNLSAAIQYSGEGPTNSAGQSVAGAGDVNGDGYDDFMVGAYQNSDAAGGAGAAYLVLGSATPAAATLGAIQYSCEASNDLAGTSVGGAGDVNGDGFADMLIGATGYNAGVSNTGVAYLVLGSATPTSASLSTAIRYTGEAESDEAGLRVQGAGDVNGDGFADFIVSAVGHDAGGNLAGAAYLVLGSSLPAGGTLGDVRFVGEAAGDRAGHSIGGGGDVNGDGSTDLLVGARENDDGPGTDGGAVYALFSDALAAGVGPYRQRIRLEPGGDAQAIDFRQARVRVDFSANAASGGDVSVVRHLIHPCNNALRLQMPIWDISSAKMAANTTVGLRFEYTDAQLDDMIEANLQLYQRPVGQPCSDWTLVPNTTVDPAVNALTVAGHSSLGQFTISDTPPSPTMIEVSGFSAMSGRQLFWPAAMLLLLVGTGATVLRLRRKGAGFEEEFVILNHSDSE